MAIREVFCILRPYTNPAQAGYWYVQNDADHQPYGITGLTQDSWDMYISFGFTATKVGALTISSDDGFTKDRIIPAIGGVGLSSARVTLWQDSLVENNGVWSVQRNLLNPGSICSYMSDLTNGNLWVQGWMHVA